MPALDPCAPAPYPDWLQADSCRPEQGPSSTHSFSSKAETYSSEWAPGHRAQHPFYLPQPTCPPSALALPPSLTNPLDKGNCLPREAGQLLTPQWAQRSKEARPFLPELPLPLQIHPGPGLGDPEFQYG